MIQTSQLRGLEGNFQAQPRVFAHDAKEIVIGAINNSDANHGINMTSGGTLYLVGDTITFTTPTGGVVGDRAVLTVLAATAIAGGAGGVITDYSITTPGATYPLSLFISLDQRLETFSISVRSCSNFIAVSLSTALI